MKTGWRSTLSRVQPVKRTSPTSARPDPVRRLHFPPRRRDIRRRRFLLQLLQLRVKIAKQAIIKSCPHAPCIDQLLFIVVHPQQQRPEAFSRTLGLRESDDHKFLPLFAFAFEPGSVAPRNIWRIRSLGDDPFQRQAARLAQNLFTGRIKMLAVANPLAQAALREQFLQPRLAFDQGRLRQVHTVEKGEIESKEHGRCLLLALQHRL